MARIKRLFVCLLLIGGMVEALFLGWGLYQSTQGGVMCMQTPLIGVQPVMVGSRDVLSAEFSYSYTMTALNVTVGVSGEFVPESISWNQIDGYFQEGLGRYPVHLVLLAPRYWVGWWESFGQRLPLDIRWGQNSCGATTPVPNTLEGVLQALGLLPIPTPPSA